MELNLGWKPEKPFRIWLSNLYYENQKEREYFSQDCISLKKYFNNNKWWLKNKFKEETGNGFQKS